ncbi:hypothetical protein [Pseudomonas sp. LD120]|uniref:hypothetical protein n=1 Tax=Pseudomonas sp. LD120 TaxID=485751 RepID=UPI003531D5CC
MLFVTLLMMGSQAPVFPGQSGSAPWSRLAGGRKVLLGTPVQIVDELATWCEEYAAGGFNVLFTHLPEAIEDFRAIDHPAVATPGLAPTAVHGAYPARTPGICASGKPNFQSSGQWLNR